MNSSELCGQTALVTGASSGLGAAFARLLAARGCRLILTARRAERLEALKAELQAAHGIQAAAVPADLAAEGGPAALAAAVDALGWPVEVLINNAGRGVWGPHRELDWPTDRQMLRLDILAAAELVHLYLPAMLARGSGRILLVSSVAAYQPTPNFASYGAAKSYLLNFGEALHRELRGSGVTVTVLSPGITQTEFFAAAGQEKLSLYQRLTMMSAEQAAEIGLRALLRGRAAVVPGLLNGFFAWGASKIPRAWAAAATDFFLTFDRR